ncbi:pyruvate kinase alpha/beta domain-containing protein [Cupriavidus basilensis]
MSRHRIHVPIYAMTPIVASQRKMQLYRNVVPLPLDASTDRDTALEQAEELLLAQGVVPARRFHRADHRRAHGPARRRNTLKIVRVGS